MDDETGLRCQFPSAGSGSGFLLTFIVFRGVSGTNLPALVSPALNPYHANDVEA